jgi:hypothetical protein
MIKRKPLNMHLEGDRFGKLLVVSFLGHADDSGKGASWICECDCGKVKSFSATRLRPWGADSCGCTPAADKSIFGKHKKLASTYIRGALDRDLDFRLTPDQFAKLVEGDCHYCGAKPRYKAADRCETNGIDRSDSKIGYELDNCVSCCTTCNLAKRDMRLDDFQEWLKQVSLHRSKANLKKLCAQWGIAVG